MRPCLFAAAPVATQNQWERVCNDNGNFTADHDYLILRINPDVTSYSGASTQRFSISDNGLSATAYPTAIIPQIEVTFTPEPSSLGAIGLIGLGLLRRRSR